MSDILQYHSFRSHNASVWDRSEYFRGLSKWAVAQIVKLFWSSIESDIAKVWMALRYCPWELFVSCDQLGETQPMPDAFTSIVNEPREGSCFLCVGDAPKVI